MLASLKDVWNQRELPFSNPPTFHAWFLEYCREVVVHSMIRPVREKAGLGSPPYPYYTNAVESKNNILKQQVDYKASELPAFVDHMKALLQEQRIEVEWAVATSGEYRLAPKYVHLAFQSQKWFKMNEEQRCRKLEKFMKAPVSCEAVHGDSERTAQSSSVNPLLCWSCHCT